MAKILLVDDSTATLDLFRLVLSQMGGHDVTTAEGGLVAITRYEEARQAGEPFDLLLLDQSMPVLSGTDVTAIIRQREGESNAHKMVKSAPVPIALLSAHLAPGADKPIKPADIERLGICGVWQKPIEIQVLLDNIQEVLEQ